MEMLLQEVERALKGRAYYLALVLALTLPDICASLESPTGHNWGKRGEKKYKEWYRKHLADRFRNMTADDCYRYRCGVVHRGAFGRKGEYTRIVFTLPNSGLKGLGIFDSPHGGHFPSNLLVFDVDWFCREIVSAVRSWFETAKTDTNVQANLPGIVSFRPDGIFSPQAFIQMPMIY